MLIVYAYFASASAVMRCGDSHHACIFATRRSIVRGSPYPSESIHFSITALEIDDAEDDLGVDGETVATL